MRPSTSWERQCHRRARRVKGKGKKGLDSLCRCSSGPRMNAHVGQERGACMANEVEVHFVWQLILSSDQNCGCWLVGEEEQCALLPESSMLIWVKMV